MRGSDFFRTTDMFFHLSLTLKSDVARHHMSQPGSTARPGYSRHLFHSRPLHYKHWIVGTRGWGILPNGKPMQRNCQQRLRDKFFWLWAFRESSCVVQICTPGKYYSVAENNREKSTIALPRKSCLSNFVAFIYIRTLGNLGDVIQPMALEHLLTSVAPDACFWYAHPWDEDLIQGNRIGEFFGADTSRLIHLRNDDIWQV